MTEPEGSHIVLGLLPRSESNFCTVLLQRAAPAERRGKVGGAQAFIAELERQLVDPQGRRIIGGTAFPRWVMEGTSLYEGVAKPADEKRMSTGISIASAKFPELVWMPAVMIRDLAKPTLIE